MRTDTVLDLLMRCRQEDERNFENTFKQKVLGITVLTKYNNKTYRVDDVDFNITPASTFLKKDVETTIQKYYIDVSSCKSRLSVLHFIFVFFSFSFVAYFIPFNRNTNWKSKTQHNHF